MTPDSDDRADELLDDDDLLEPDPEQPAPAAADPTPPPQTVERHNPPAEAAAPNDDGGEAAAPVQAAPAAVPRRKSYWHVWAIIFLLLVLAVVGLGWYVGELRTQVDGLKGELEAAQTQASGLQSAASQVGGDLLPLAEEQAVIAQLRADSGDAEGAAYALAQAQRYVSMAERLAASGGRLGEVQQLVEEVAAKLSGSEEPAEPEPDAAEGDVPAEQTDAQAPTGDEAARGEESAEPAPEDAGTPGTDAAGGGLGSAG